MPCYTLLSSNSYGRENHVDNLPFVNRVPNHAQAVVCWDFRKNFSGVDSIFFWSRRMFYTTSSFPTGKFNFQALTHIIRERTIITIESGYGSVFTHSYVNALVHIIILFVLYTYTTSAKTQSPYIIEPILPQHSIITVGRLLLTFLTSHKINNDKL